MKEKEKGLNFLKKYLSYMLLIRILGTDNKETRWE